MIKSKLSERDICTKYITPAISDAGWNENPHHFREEVTISQTNLSLLSRQRIVHILSALEYSRD